MGPRAVLERQLLLEETVSHISLKIVPSADREQRKLRISS